MPIFRYYCKNCDMSFELLLPRYDAEAFCPKCGAEDIEKELNKIAIAGSKKSGCSLAESCPSAAGGCCCGAGGCVHKH